MPLLGGFELFRFRTFGRISFHTHSLSLGSESDLLSYAALSPSLFVSVYFYFSLTGSWFDFVFVFVKLQALQIGFISSYLDFSPMNEVFFFFFLNTPFINLLTLLFTGLFGSRETKENIIN